MLIIGALLIGRPRDPVQRAATYSEVTLTGFAGSPQWRPFAMSASGADHDRFRAELQRRIASCTSQPGLILSFY